MSNSHESWARARDHLRRAASLDGAPGLELVHDYLDHDQLQLAADLLVERGTERGELARPFWEALRHAYEELALEPDAMLCMYRMQEAERGYLEARLTLVATEDGGRSAPIATGYRSSWNVRAGGGAPELRDGPLSLEDRRSLAPGQTATVRLHPLHPDGWRGVRDGDRLDMHEGSRVVGTALVLRVVLRPT